MQPTLEDKVNKLVSYILLLLIIVLGVSFFRSFTIYKRAQDKLSNAETQLGEEQEEQKALMEELRVTTSHEFRERQARDKLGLAREGEIILVLPEDEVIRKLVSEPEENDFVLPEQNWKRWLELFWGHQE